MHLLGVSFTMVLDPGTRGEDHPERAALQLRLPEGVQRGTRRRAPGDQIQVNCTYNPELAQELLILRKAPPHFVTFGDGSTTVCVGVSWQTTARPDAKDPI